MEQTSKNRYAWLGFALGISGAILAPIFYFLVDSVPLTALGISAIIIGLVSAALGSTRPGISPEACQMMLRTGVENIAILLEELGLRAKAIYMPSSADGGHPRALIPLNENDTAIKAARHAVGNRLIARHGPNPEDMCLSVVTPGAVSLESLELRPTDDPPQIESALNNLLVGTLDLASSVSVRLAADRVQVEIAGPRLRYQNVWFYRCLGSPLASIAATVVSEVLKKPVRISAEEETRKGIKVEIEVLS